jgi:hypothetical protein
MQFYVEDAAKEAQSHFYVQSALAMIALTVALVIYLMHKWSFKVVNVDQLIALHLFMLIPKSEMNELVQEARAVVDRFDKFGEVHAADEDQMSIHELMMDEDPTTPTGGGKRVGFAVPEDGGDNKEEELPADESDGHESETTVETDVTADEVNKAMQISRATQMCVLFLLGLQFVVSTLAGVMVLLLYSEQGSVETAWVVREEGLHLAQLYRSNTFYLTRQAQDFAQYGDFRFYRNYWELHHSSTDDMIFSRLVELGATKEEQLKVAEAQYYGEDMIRLEMISMVMTMKVFDMDPSEAKEVEGFHWDVREDEHFEWTLVHDNGYHYKNREHDLALPKDQLHKIARSILFDAKFDYEKEHVVQPLHDFELLLHSRTQKDVDEATLRTYTYYTATIVQFIILTVSFITMMAIQYHTPPLRSLRILQILNVANLLTAILMLVLLGMAMSATARISEIHVWKEEARQLALEETDHTSYLTDACREFVQFGDIRAYKKYWKLIHSGQIEAVLEKQKDLGLTEEELDLLHEAEEEMENLRTVDKIAMLLIARSYNLPLYKTTDINEITWDAEAEPDYEAQRLAYPQKLLWYSAREKDLALPAAEMRELGRYIMFDHRYEAALEHTREAVSKFTDNKDKRAKNNLKAVETEVLVIANLLAVATGLFLGSAIGLVMYLISKMLDFHAQSSLDSQLLKYTSGNFGNTHQGRSLAAIGAALLFAVSAFFYAAVYHMLWLPHVDTYNTATHRNWIALRCLFHVEDAVAHAEGVPERAKYSLMRDIDSLGQVQNKLYFGVDSSGNARSEMQLPKNQAEIYVEVDGLMTQWMDIARTVGTQKLTSVAEGQKYLEQMFSIYDQLMIGLERSADLYQADAMHAQSLGRTLDIVLVVVLAFLILGLYILIIAPSIENLVMAGKGTQV